MTRPVRVRFAPSPTGPLHIGGVRTALFNYLFAKKHGGVFYLRIEDTDQNRYVAGAEEYILEALDWLGIAPSETVGRNEKYGPYRQSDRKHLYKQYAEQLIAAGHAYYAFDTAAALDELRSHHEKRGETFMYNHAHRLQLDNALVCGNERALDRIAQGEDYVIRFKIPENKTLYLQDLIRGVIQVDTNLLDDKVLFKSDGMPTYHLANMVDDHLMETSHVIRGEEWLPSMPLHVLLYDAFGWEPPFFAHLPLILKPVGNGKLSKRDGDKMGFPVFPLEWIDPATGEKSTGYREKGYFPEAVVNFLALLGWNDGSNQELFTLNELVAAFDLSRVHKAGAKFDPEKNKWFNHQYLIKRDNAALTADFNALLVEKGIALENPRLERIVELIKDRANFVSDFWDLADYFFIAPNTFDEKALKSWKPETPALLEQASKIIAKVDDFTPENIEIAVKNWLAESKVPTGALMPALRLCIVGALKGPHLFDIIALIGKAAAVDRIAYLLNEK